MMQSFARLCAGASLLCLVLPDPAAAADTSLSIGDIIVTARAVPGGEPPATSIDRLGSAEVQNAKTGYVWELIGQMPGVMVTNFNQGTTSGKFSFRGFNGEGEINAVKLLIDGIPSNSNDGNMPFLDTVFPLDMAGVEVVRGTSDPRSGLHNIAGNVNILTRSGGTYLEARLLRGSDDLAEAQLVGGLENGKLSQNYAIAYRDADGFRDHAALDRLGLSGKWAYQLSDALRLGLSVRHYQANAEEPGYLTQAEARLTPRMTNAFNATDGAHRQMQQASLYLDANLGAASGLVVRLYTNRLRDDRYVKFSANVSQQRRQTDEDQLGATAALHWQGSLARMPLTLEAGGDIQHQDNESRRALTADRRVQSQTRNQHFTLDVGGVYVQAALDPNRWLRITPGYRIDWVGGTFVNRLSGASAPINDYGAIHQPKLSIAVTAARNLTWYGSWGRSFQIGVGSGAYLIPPRQRDLAASSNTGWEMGVKLEGPHGLQARLAGWQQSATGEIKRRLNDPLGDFDNLGATLRRGADLQANISLSSSLDVHGSLSWQKAIVTRPDPATPSLAGNNIDHVPHWLVSAGLDYRPSRSVRMSLSTVGQSAYHLTAANTQGRWGNYMRVDGELAWSPVPQIELAASLRNVADVDYAYVWWDGTKALFSPAEGRSVTLSARTRF